MAVARVVRKCMVVMEFDGGSVAGCKVGDCLDERNHQRG